MSVALQCDRCKTYFTPGKTPGDFIKLANPRIYDNSCFDSIGRCEKRKALMVNTLAPDDYMDLCPECSWFFLKFMDGRNVSFYMKENETVEEYMKGYPGGDTDGYTDGDELPGSQQKQGC